MKGARLLLVVCVAGAALPARAQQGEPVPASAAPADAAPAPADAAAAPLPDAPATGTAEAGDAAASDGAAPPEAAPLSRAELEALGFAASGETEEVSGLDTSLHVWGFIDFSVSRLIAAEQSQIRGYFADKTNFYIGNFNLYLSKNLTKSFRTMGEVRFLYEPNGDIPLSVSRGTPTTSSDDHADFERPLHWGGVEIERVYLDWIVHRFLTIRLGQFLTPYGIWNVDHGSPTVIPVQKPYVVGPDLFPERQTGFELFGRWDATNRGTLGYHLTLSNGQGPITEYRDLDENKAIGGRLFWEQHGLGTFRVGTSAYYGRNTDASTALVPTAAGTLKSAETVYVQYDALALAVDAVWKYRGLVLQTEVITRQNKFTERGRSLQPNELLQQAVFPPDAVCWGMYALAGYRLPWYGIMPYFVGQYYDNTTDNGVRTKTTDLQWGLNIRVVDAVVFKLEYSYAFFSEELFGSDDPIQFLQGQAAWAF